LKIDTKEKQIWATIDVAASAVEEAVSDQAVLERCTKQLAQTAVRKLKYLSSHPVIDRYTAENATRNINQRDINFNKLNL
jgi:hypothetical protein